MKTSLRITAAAAMLAGASLSGCAGDPYYDSRTYAQGYYSQPAYQSSRYYDWHQNAPAGYSDPQSASGTYPYHANRPSAYYWR